MFVRCALCLGPTGKGMQLVLPSLIRWSSSSINKTLTPTPAAEEIPVSETNGRIRIIIPLTQGKTAFSFNSCESVGKFVASVKAEDGKVGKVKAIAITGETIADSTPLAAILTGPFKINIDDRTFSVNSSFKGPADAVDAISLQELLQQVRSSFLSKEVIQARLSDAEGRLASLQQELAPMEAIRATCEAKAKRTTTVAAWAGLGAMCMNWGLMAQLTWYEFSWDIMEPVTYFLGYGTAIGFAAYYVVTRREYSYEVVGERKHLKTLYKVARRAKLDIAKYNTLQDGIFEAQQEIQALKWRL